MAFNDIAPIGVTFEVDTSGLRKAESAISGVGNNVTKKMSGVGKAAGFAIAAGITAAAASIGKAAFNAISEATNAARDFGETLSATGVLFGKEQQAEVSAWADGMASAFGISANSSLEAANTFATFGKSAGLSGSSLTDFSIDLTELAGDLASFKNTSPEEAIQAIGSALRGETEPIRKYGVLLDDASLKAEALRQGIIKTTKGALTPQQKVLAANALIFANTTSAQGDSARTANDLAGQQRRLTAELENTKKKVGDEFLPIQLELTKAFRDMLPELKANLIPAIKDLAGSFKTDILPSIITLLPVLVQMASFLGRNSQTILTLTPVMFGLVGAMKAVNVVTMLQSSILKGHPIIGLAAILIPLIAYLVNLGIKTGFFTDAFKRLGDTMNLIGAVIGKVVADSGKAIGDFFSGIFDFLGGMGDALYNFGKDAWQMFVQGALDALMVLPNLAANILGKIPFIGEGLSTGIKNLTGGAREAISNATGTQNTAATGMTTKSASQVNYYNVSAQGLTVDAVTRDAKRRTTLQAPVLGGA